MPTLFQRQRKPELVVEPPKLTTVCKLRQKYKDVKGKQGQEGQGTKAQKSGREQIARIVNKLHE